MKMIRLILKYVKTKYTLILPYLVSIGVLLLLILTIDQSNGIIIENAVLKNEKESLHKQTKFHLVRQKELEIKYESKMVEIKKLTIEINQAKVELKNLKIKYYEKINNVDSYTITDLQLFFSKRYAKGGPVE